MNFCEILQGTQERLVPRFDAPIGQYFREVLFRQRSWFHAAVGALTSTKSAFSGELGVGFQVDAAQLRAAHDLCRTLMYAPGRYARAHLLACRAYAAALEAIRSHPCSRSETSSHEALCEAARIAEQPLGLMQDVDLELRYAARHGGKAGATRKARLHTTVPVFLVRPDRAFVANLTLELIKLGTGCLYPDTRQAFAAFDDEFHGAFRAAKVWLRGQGLWPVDADIRWFFTVPELQQERDWRPDSLHGDSAGLVVARGLARLLRRAGYVPKNHALWKWLAHDFLDVGGLAAIDSDGRLRGVGGEFHKLLAARDRSLPRLRHIVASAVQKDDFKAVYPPLETSDRLDGIQFLYADTIDSAIGQVHKAKARERVRRRLLVSVVLAPFVIGAGILLHQHVLTREAKARADAEAERVMQARSQSAFYEACHALDENDDNKALAYLARSLSLNPGNQAALTRLSTLLLYHNWLIPTAEIHKTNAAGHVGFSGDGKRILALSGDYSFSVRDSQTGQLLSQMALGINDGKSGAASRVTPSNGWTTAQFGQAGNLIFAANERTGDACTWDSINGKLLHAWQVSTNEDRRRTTIDALPRRTIIEDWQGSADGDNDPFEAYNASSLGMGMALAHPFAEFSADGKYVAVMSRSSKSQVRVFDNETGRPLDPPLDHGTNGTVVALAFTPDNHKLMTLLLDESTSWSNGVGRIVATKQLASIWDAGSRRLVRQFQVGTTNSPPDLAFEGFSRDGKLLLFVNGLVGRSEVWETETGKRLSGVNFPGGQQTCACLSPDARFIAVLFGRKGQVFDAVTGRPVSEPFLLGGVGYRVECSLDGNKLLTATKDGILGVWDCRPGAALATPIVGNESSDCYADAWREAQFTGDGGMVLTRSGDTVRIWNAATGGPMGQSMVHGTYVVSARLSGDGRTIVTVAEKGGVALWDARSGRKLKDLRKSHDGYPWPEVSDDGKRFLTVNANTVGIWDVSDGRLVRAFTNVEQMSSAEFSPSGLDLIICRHAWFLDHEVPTVGVLSLETGVQIFGLTNRWDESRAMLSPDGRWMYVSALGAYSGIYDLRARRPVFQTGYYSLGVNAVFSPDSSEIAVKANTSSWDEFQLLDLRTGTQTAKPVRHSSGSGPLAFSPDGQMIVTAAPEGLPQFWDRQTGLPLIGAAEWPHTGSRPAKRTGWHFSPGAKRLVASLPGPGRLCEIWDVAPSLSSCSNWLPALASAVAGKRVSETGVLEECPNAFLQLQKVTSELRHAQDTNGWSVLGRWFLANRATRTISPFSTITLPDHVTTLLKERTSESLDEALAYSFALPNVTQRVGALRKAVDCFDRAREGERAGEGLGEVSNYGKAIEADPTYLPAYYHRALAYETSSNYLAAISDYSVIIKGAPHAALAYRRRASARTRQKDFEGTTADYSSIIQLVPDDEVAYYSRGRAKIQKHDEAGAIRDYKKAIELFPRYIDAHYALASAYEVNSNFDGAISEYNALIALDPGEWFWCYARGNEKASKQDHKGAIADYDRAVALFNRYNVSGDVYINRGVEKLRMGDLARAIQDFTDAINVKGYADVPLAYYDRGIGYHTLGKTGPAIQDFSKAIKLRPSDGDAYLARGAAREQQGDVKGALSDYGQAADVQPPLAAAFYRRGRLKMQEGQPAAAIADCSTAVAVRPDYADAFAVRGAAKCATGDIAGGLNDLNRAIELNPSDGASFANRGHAKRAKADWDGAIADYTTALKLNPDGAGVFANRAIAKAAKDDYDGAGSDSDKAIVLNPALADGYLSRALVNLGRGDFVGAISNCTTALSLQPRFASAYFLRGSVKLDSNDFDGAVTDFTKAVELQPDLAGAYNKRGLAKRRKGDYDGELADYMQAIRLKPECADPYVNRGNAFRHKGDLTNALKDYDRAIELQPDLASAYFNRGTARRKQADLTGAIRDLTTTIRLAPSDPDAYRYRGLAEQQSGDLDAAMKDYTKAIEANPQDGRAYHALGCLRYDTQSFASALEDFRKEIALAPKESDYAYLRVWLIQTRLGVADAAKAQLRGYLKVQPKGKQTWLAQIAHFLLGDITESEFLKLGRDDNATIQNERQCEAYFYAGSKRLIAGDKDTAADYFGRCLATGSRTFDEYDSATAELARLHPGGNQAVTAMQPNP